MLTGLSQRVAYFYPTGVTLLHTSSPSSLRARLRAVARAWVCVEVTRAPVAGWGLVRHRARLHQSWGRAQLGQEEHPGPEPCLFGRGAPVVAWQGIVFLFFWMTVQLELCFLYFLWSSRCVYKEFNPLVGNWIYRILRPFVHLTFIGVFIFFFPGWC